MEDGGLGGENEIVMTTQFLNVAPDIEHKVPIGVNLAK